MPHGTAAEPPPPHVPGFSGQGVGKDVSVCLPWDSGFQAISTGIPCGFSHPEPFCQLSGFSRLKKPRIGVTGEPAFASGLDLALTVECPSEEEKKGIFEVRGPSQSRLTLKRLHFIMARPGTKSRKPGKKSGYTAEKVVKHPQAREPGPPFLHRLCDGFQTAFPGRR